VHKIVTTSVLTKIQQIERFLVEMSKNPELEIPTKYQFLAQKQQELSDPLNRRRNLRRLKRFINLSATSAERSENDILSLSVVLTLQ